MNIKPNNALSNIIIKLLNIYNFDKVIVHHIDMLSTGHLIVSVEIYKNNKIHFKNLFIDEECNFELDL